MMARQALRLAMASLRAGRPKEAEVLCHGVLRLSPSHGATAFT